ncbi:MAG: CRISPR-associated endonuclease Cas1 [Promethearchaeota archaeon]
MILTLHIHGTSVRKVKNMIEIYIPPEIHIPAYQDYLKPTFQEMNAKINLYEKQENFNNEKLHDEQYKKIQDRKILNEKIDKLMNEKCNIQNEILNEISNSKYSNNKKLQTIENGKEHLENSNNLGEKSKNDNNNDETNQENNLKRKSKDKTKTRKKEDINNQLAFMNKPIKKPIHVRNISAIIISGNVSITMPAMKLITQHAIPIIFTNKNKPIGILNPFAAHGSVKVRKKQFQAIESEKGFYIAKQMIAGALENKAKILLFLAKNRKKYLPLTAKNLRNAAKEIRIDKNRILNLNFDHNLKKNRINIMGLEGDASTFYFAALKSIIPQKFQFQKRTRRPPKDPINAMLSLGYAILQGFITTAVAAVGLEPYAGVLHADRSGKPSLVLDMMEEFRQETIDRLVIKIATKNILQPYHFKKDATGVKLTENAKNKFLNLVYHRIGPKRPEELERTTHKNYYKDIIRQARNLSRFLLGLSPTYQPYSITW